MAVVRLNYALPPDVFSFFRYGFEGMMLSIFHNYKFQKCSGPQAPDGKCLQFYADGNSVLHMFQFEQPLGMIVGLQIAVLIALKILAYAILRTVAKRPL